jgi:hypothetical protein
MAPFGLARARQEHKAGKCRCRACPKIGLTRASHSIHLCNNAAFGAHARRVERVHGCDPRCKAASPRGRSTNCQALFASMKDMWDFDGAMWRAEPAQSAAETKNSRAKRTVARQSHKIRGVWDPLASNGLSTCRYLPAN